MNRGEILRTGLDQMGVTQSELSRRSGVPQSRISQYVTGKLEPSEPTFDRLLSMLGLQVEVELRPVHMERSELRSWLLHREVSRKTIDGLSQEDWDRMRRVLQQVQERSQGPTHENNLERWRRILERQDEREFHRVLVDTSDDGISMRETSPVTGFLTEDERLRLIRDSWTMTR